MYNVQGIIYPEGGVISVFFLLFCFFVSFYYLIRLIQEEKFPYYLKGLLRLFVLLTVYGLIMMLSGEKYYIFGNEVSNFIYLKIHLMSILPIFPLYYFTIRGQLRLEIIQKWLLIFCVVIILTMIKQFIAVQNMLFEQGSVAQEGNMNVGYLFLALMPAVYLFKKTSVRFLVAIFCLIFVMAAMKRGAILIGAFCLTLFIITSLKKSNQSTKLVTLFLTIVLLGIIVWYFEYKMATSDYFLMRLEKTVSGDDTSGRDTIFSTLWNHFLDNNILYQLIGEGANATLKVAGIYAHNDWLEILTNQGLLGIFLYLLYWLNFTQSIHLEKRNRNSLSVNILKMSFLILFMKTFFSMAVSDMSIYANCFIAFALGYRKQQELLKGAASGLCSVKHTSKIIE